MDNFTSEQTMALNQLFKIPSIHDNLFEMYEEINVAEFNMSMWPQFVFLISIDDNIIEKLNKMKITMKQRRLFDFDTYYVDSNTYQIDFDTFISI